MIGIEEGKTVIGGNVRILFLVCILTAAFTMLVGLNGFYASYIGKYEESANKDVYNGWSDLMRNNPVPVRSVYTSLQDSKDTDFYFIAVTYVKGGASRTDAYTNDNDLSMSDEDRSTFITEVSDQFDVSLTEGNLHTSSGIVNEVRSILHSYTDKMCEVYYNPQHSDKDNYYPPYLYIIVREDMIVGM